MKLFHSNSPHIPSEPLAEQEIYRYRKQRGINLGSWFVLERWITEQPFRLAHSPSKSDLDVARGSNPKTLLENHWDQWISLKDWEWIASRGVNTVRIPIGYYHLCGIHPSIIQGTEFAPFNDVFNGAWSRITNAIQTAHQFGIGVLLDLHAAPGGQNSEPHCGTSSPPTFFKNKKNMSHTINILRLLLNALHSHKPPLPNVVGIELLNEPQPPSDDVLKTWYTQAIKTLSTTEPGLPIYIGECWRPESYADFINSLHTSPFVVLDHHLYRCFTSQDTSTSASEHARALTDPNAHIPRVFSQISQSVPMVVGEWSGALNPGSLQLSADEREAKRLFVEAQLNLFERHCSGWFWWTYKKEYSGDTGWSFRDAVESGVFLSSIGMKANKAYISENDRTAQQQRGIKARDQALGEHNSYWSRFPGKYEHWRFSDGFVRGWDDAYEFFTFSPDTERPVSELGFAVNLRKKRSAEHIAQKGAGKNIWEYEHGFSQGVDMAKSDFQQYYC